MRIRPTQAITLRKSQPAACGLKSVSIGPISAEEMSSPIVISSDDDEGEPTVFNASHPKGGHCPFRQATMKESRKCSCQPKHGHCPFDLTTMKRDGIKCSHQPKGGHCPFRVGTSVDIS